MVLGTLMTVKSLKLTRCYSVLVAAWIASIVGSKEVRFDLNRLRMKAVGPLAGSQETYDWTVDGESFSQFKIALP